MWIISKKRLKEFWEQPGREDARGPLEDWHTVVGAAEWQNFGDLRRTYGSADVVGDCVVFNIAGNKYRLVVRLRYRSHKVFILKVMTHAEYDRGRWVEQCGCFTEDPRGRIPSRRNPN